MAISRRRKSRGKHSYKRHKHHSTHRRKVKRYSRRGTKRRRRKRTKRVKRGGTRKNVMKGGAKYIITVTPSGARPTADATVRGVVEKEVYTGKPRETIAGRYPPTEYNILKKTIHQYSDSRDITIGDFIKNEMKVTVPRNIMFSKKSAGRITEYITDNTNITDKNEQAVDIKIIRDNTISGYGKGAPMSPEKEKDLREGAIAAYTKESKKSEKAYETYEEDFEARRLLAARTAERRGEKVVQAMPFEEWERASDDEIAQHERQAAAQEEAFNLDKHAAANTRNWNIKMDKIKKLINELIKKNSGALKHELSYPARLRAAEDIVYNNEAVKREGGEDKDITNADIDAVIVSSLERNVSGKEVDIQTGEERREAAREEEAAAAAAEKQRRSNEEEGVTGSDAGEEATRPDQQPQRLSLLSESDKGEDSDGD